MEFHPRYEGDLSRLNNSKNDTTSDESQHEVSSLALTVSQDTVGSNHSQRVEDLEREVAQMKCKVVSMDAKLDLLVAAALPGRVSSTPRKAPQQQSSRDDRLPHPRRLHMEADRDGYVEKLLQEERFVTPHTEGKAQHMSDIFTECVIPKPYMYVEREGAQTLKQKLDNRTSLSPMEYVNAAIALVNDNRAYDGGDRGAILRHIQDVTHDIMERPWDVVRRWSQRVWDAVEKKHFTWGDDQHIQNLRASIAISGSNKTTQGNSNSEGKGSKSEVICRMYNSRNGCRSRSHHDEANVRYLHICAFCDSLGRHCPGHNVLGCNNKSNYPGQPRMQTLPTAGPYSNQPPRPLPQDPPSWRAQQAPPSYQPQYYQASKNGF